MWSLPSLKEEWDREGIIINNNSYNKIYLILNKIKEWGYSLWKVLYKNYFSCIIHIKLCQKIEYLKLQFKYISLSQTL